MKKFIFMLCAFSFSASAQIPQFEEIRYCGEPQRDFRGIIYRNPRVIAKFKDIHPCPENGKTSGSCPGWAIDHVIPLACGGCDSVSNMQWLPDALKSAAKSGKDRFERRIYQKGIDCE